MLGYDCPEIRDTLSVPHNSTSTYIVYQEISMNLVKSREMIIFGSLLNTSEMSNDIGTGCIFSNIVLKT